MASAAPMLAPAPARTIAIGAIRTAALNAPGMGAARVLTFYDEQMRPVAHAEVSPAILEAFAYDALAVSTHADGGQGVLGASPSVLSILAPDRMEIPRK